MKVCWHLNRLIRTLPDLLLKIELHVSGRKLLRNNNLPPANDLLEELQARFGSRTRSTLELKHEDNVQLPWNFFMVDWMFKGNVYVQFRRSVSCSGLLKH